MSNLRDKAAALVESFVLDAIEAGLTWDEAVAVFGLAAKAAACAAAKGGDGTLDECVSHARKRLDEAFAQDVQVVVAEASLDENPLLATARRRHLAKHH